MSDVRKGAVKRALATTPAMALAGLMSESDRARRAVEQRQKLGTADLRLLWLLGDGRARTMREVADELRLEQSTVNRQVAAAQRHGYVRRVAPAAGGAMVVEDTERGAEVVADDIATLLAAINTALADFDDSEVDELIGLLSRFVAAYSRAVDAPPRG